MLAAAERGGLLHAPDSHMQKIIVGPTAKGRVHIDAPVIENLRALAKAFSRDIEDLTIVVLDRPRHDKLIAELRGIGCGVEARQFIVIGQCVELDTMRGCARHDLAGFEQAVGHR